MQPKSLTPKLLASGLFLAALLFGIAPATAFDTRTLGQQGSLTLDDLFPLLDSVPALKKEVDQALAQSKKKPEDILCDGMRFPGSWEHLAGMRASPYYCDFDGKWLQIQATVRLTARNGRVYERVSRDAMKNAYNIRETGLKWTWAAERPPESQAGR
jgi:hypothetical protein